MGEIDMAIFHKFNPFTVLVTTMIALASDQN